MKSAMTMDRLCPLCGGVNDCRLAKGCLYKGPCWCESASIPAHLLHHLANLHPEPTCLCGRCMSSVARHAALHDAPEKIIALVRAEMTATPLDAAEDFYLDPGGQTVFTAAYHLKRGYCCNSGCRHCPFTKPSGPTPASTNPPSIHRVV